MKPLGKVTEGYQGQLVVKNALKVDNIWSNGIKAKPQIGQAMASMALV